MSKNTVAEIRSELRELDTELNSAMKAGDLDYEDTIREARAAAFKRLDDALDAR